MFTAGEKRGLFALIILLTLLIVFVICRRSLFSPSAEIAHPPVVNDDGIVLNDSLADSSFSIDSLALTPLAPNDTTHKAKSIKTRKKRKSNKKLKRAPIVRDPLSEPLNN